MNKWYRLGKKFNGEFHRGLLNSYLRKNNLYTTSNSNKDFKDEDYEKLCILAGITSEIEEKQYKQGERKYFFYWGLEKEMFNND